MAHKYSGPTLIHVLNGPKLRGAERFAIELAEGLAELGIKQKLVFLRGCPQNLTGIPGCDVSVVPTGVSRFPFLRRILTSCPNSVALCHGQGPQKATVMSLLMAGNRRPILAVKQIGMLTSWIHHQKKLRIWLNRWLMSRMDICVCLGPNQVSELQEILDVPAEKIIVIPNGRRLPATAAAKADTETERVDTEILIVGALTPEKNLELALDLVAQLQKGFRSVCLSILGDGPLRGELELRAASDFVPNSVRFFGDVSDVWSHYKRAGILLLCSQTEGVPGVVLEATLAGLPTIAWDVGDISTILEDGENGHLVPFGDTKALLAAMSGVLGDRLALMELRSRTARRAKLMSFDRIVEAYAKRLKLYPPRAQSLRPGIS